MRISTLTSSLYDPRKFLFPFNGFNGYSVTVSQVLFCHQRLIFSENDNSTILGYVRTTYVQVLYAPLSHLYVVLFVCRTLVHMCSWVNRQRTDSEKKFQHTWVTVLKGILDFVFVLCLRDIT